MSIDKAAERERLKQEATEFYRNAIKRMAPSGVDAFGWMNIVELLADFATSRDKAAYDAGHSAGRREGIEDAAKVADEQNNYFNIKAEKMDADKWQALADRALLCAESSRKIAAAIRALTEGEQK